MRGGGEARPELAGARRHVVALEIGWELIGSGAWVRAPRCTPTTHLQSHEHAVLACASTTADPRTASGGDGSERHGNEGRHNAGHDGALLEAARALSTAHPTSAPGLRLSLLAVAKWCNWPQAETGAGQCFVLSGVVKVP
jgi:hypothetical protein